MAEANGKGPEVESFLSINEACKRYSFSRATFYRMYDDPASDLRDVVVRIPPQTGRIRIPSTAFESWLRSKRRGRSS